MQHETKHVKIDLKSIQDTKSILYGETKCTPRKSSQRYIFLPGHTQNLCLILLLEM